MAKLNLEWLAVFDEIYKTGSVSRAAERLDIAQATASVALNKLRTHFGDKLFSRTSKGMEPTPFAQQIHAELREAMSLLEKASAPRRPFDPVTEERTFRIAMTDISEVVLLPTLVNHLHKIAPRVHIEAEMISTDSPRQLETGEVDLAVGFMPNLESGFYQQTLFTQNFVCMVARNHPRVKKTLTRTAFLDEGHVVVATSGTGHRIVDKVMEQLHIERNVVLRVPTFLGVARIVAQTELLVIVPHRLGQAFSLQEQVKLLEPPIPLPSFEVKQHWHDRYHANPGNAWLRQTIADLFSARGPLA
jgi:DNA-binding transcriptional LysR family regulator